MAGESICPLTGGLCPSHCSLHISNRRFTSLAEEDAQSQGQTYRERLAKTGEDYRRKELLVTIKDAAQKIDEVLYGTCVNDPKAK